MLKGTVKFYNNKNKFGFIKADESGAELYVRKSGLIDPIEEGDRVEFEIEEHEKGPKAFNVRKISGE